jgi:acetate kinase
MEKNLSGREGKISIEESRIGVYVFKTDEELMVMRQCLKILAENENRK